MPAPPSVLILMCTYNGARWLPAQLESLAAQDHADWALWVSDDGSTDTSRDIVAAFAAERGGRNEVRLVEGPRQGPGANFLSLLCRDDLPLGPETHVAFSDQDDIWLPDRLSCGLAGLADAEGPAIHGGQSIWIDDAGRVIGGSRPPRARPVLRHAVLKTLAGGNTLLLNPEAVALVRRAGAPGGIAFHDWWLLLLLMAAGGSLRIGAEPVLKYRRHEANALGPHGGIAAGLARLRLVLSGEYGGWMAANLAALAQAPVPLTGEARALIDGLRSAPRAGPGRLRRFRALGLHRESRSQTGLLWLAALIGRL